MIATSKQENQNAPKWAPTTKKAQRHQKQYFAAMFGNQNKNWNKRKFMEPSISISSAWTTLEEYSKPHFEAIPEIKPGVVGIEAECGKVFPYLTPIDQAKPTGAIVLKDYEGEIPNLQTIEDPVMRKIAKEGKAQVFATDFVLAVLMSCQSSNYSWDIQVKKFKDMVFLDVREDPNIL